MTRICNEMEITPFEASSTGIQTGTSWGQKTLVKAAKLLKNIILRNNLVRVLYIEWKNYWGENDRKKME